MEKEPLGRKEIAGRRGARWHILQGCLPPWTSGGLQPWTFLALGHLRVLLGGGIALLPRSANSMGVCRASEGGNVGLDFESQVIQQKSSGVGLNFGMSLSRDEVGSPRKSYSPEFQYFFQNLL